MSLGASYGSGKIVHWDGWVQEIENAVMVGELMVEHPQQVVVEFQSALKQRRPIPLPADKTLERNKVYVMLPMKPGKALRLNTEETRRILLILDSALHSKSLLFSSRLVSRLVRTWHGRPKGEGVVLQKKQEVEKGEERYEIEAEMMIGGTPEYLSRQLSGKGWKPSLDTIKEKKIDTKKSACLFLKSF